MCTVFYIPFNLPSASHKNIYLSVSNSSDVVLSLCFQAVVAVERKRFVPQDKDQFTRHFVEVSTCYKSTTVCVCVCVCVCVHSQ